MCKIGAYLVPYVKFDCHHVICLLTFVWQTCKSLHHDGRMRNYPITIFKVSMQFTVNCLLIKWTSDFRDIPAPENGTCWLCGKPYVGSGCNVVTFPVAEFSVSICSTPKFIWSSDDSVPRLLQKQKDVNIISL